MMRYADVRRRFGPSPSPKGRARIHKWSVNLTTVLSPPSADDEEPRSPSPVPSWPQVPSLGPEQFTSFARSATSTGHFTAEVDGHLSARRRRRTIPLIQALLHSAAGRIVRYKLVPPPQLKQCGPADWPPRGHGPAEPEEGTDSAVTWKPYVGHGDNGDGPDWAAWWSHRREEGDSAARRIWPLRANN